uniref:Uncharacterized protein n=1 Tax=Anguilla anguilla TaxID=7936 RepID=A0A0E9RUN4_ANGAN
MDLKSDNGERPQITIKCVVFFVHFNSAGNLNAPSCLYMGYGFFLVNIILG